MRPLTGQPAVTAPSPSKRCAEYQSFTPGRSVSQDTITPPFSEAMIDGRSMLSVDCTAATPCAPQPGSGSAAGPSRTTRIDTTPVPRQPEQSHQVKKTPLAPSLTP